MARATITTHVDKRNLLSILNALTTNQERLVSDMADDVIERARPKAAVDTGAMRAGLYKHMKNRSTYGPAAAAARARRPEAVLIPPQTPPDTKTAYVWSAVEYTVFFEFGTHKMPARPFITPATREAQADLPRRHKKMLVQLVTNGK